MLSSPISISIIAVIPRKRMNLPDIYFLSFPNANHWVSRKQWENFLHPNALEKDSYFIENMQAVADANSLRLLDADTSICPTIELRVYDNTRGKLFPISIRKIGLLSLPEMLSPCSQRIPGMDLRLRHVSGHVIQRNCACLPKPPKSKRSSTAMTLTSAAQP